MRALVLAGGAGTRLLPWTEAIPKPLAPVANRPVLCWVLDHLNTSSHMDRVGVIVRPDEADTYVSIVGETTAAGWPIDWLVEPRPLGTGGALRHQRAYLDDEPALVVPADIICPVDLDGITAHHRARRPLATVAVTPRDLTRWGGDIVIADDTGHATDYLFKPGAISTSNLGSTGTWVVEPALLDSMPDRFADFSSETLPALPPRLGVFHTGTVPLRDIGTPAALVLGNHEALANLPSAEPVPDAEVAPGAHVSGPVLLGRGARVCAGARVLGPSVIGPEAVICPGAVVTGCVVLAGARVTDQVVDAVVGDPQRALQVMLSESTATTA